MTSDQRLPTSLTPLDVALAALLNGVEAVTPVELPLAEALRCIAADMPPSGALPPHDIAASDGFALPARDLVGASSYSPLPLAALPVWVEAGDAMPGGCDCVLDADSVELSGPMPQVLAEAIPGQGVRRAGGDVAAGSRVVEAGRRMLARDLMIARAAGIERLKVRRPRLRIVNIPGAAVTSDLIAESARTAGADVVCVTADGRDAASIVAAIDVGSCDLLLLVGGSGVGRTDATVSALAGVARSSPMASPCSPAAPRRWAASATRPWSCCRARRIRRSRRGGRLRCPCLTACRDAGRARRSICRWRARSHPGLALRKSCCWSESKAPG